MKILVVGGGIAGLSVAIMLSRIGYKVNIFEKYSQLRDLGTGVQISPNGYKILQSLEVTKKINRSIFEPENIHIRDGFSGKTNLSLPIKLMTKERWGGKYLNINRFDLSSALIEEFAKYKSSRFYYGKNLRQYHQESNKVTATFEDGSIFCGDVLIGADGTFSKVRQQMLFKSKILYSGNFAWRTTIEASKIKDPIILNNNCIWVGPKKHAVTTVLKSGSIINFVGIVEGYEKVGLKTLKENREYALNDYKGWDSQLTKILREAKNIYQWPIYKSNGFEKWSHGNVVLIGDSAHPMVPSMAQGAVQALEDASTLVKYLERNPNTSRSLEKFYLARIHRTRKIQVISERNLATFHISNYLFCKILYIFGNMAAKFIPIILFRRLDWIYSFKVKFQK